MTQAAPDVGWGVVAGKNADSTGTIDLAGAKSPEAEGIVGTKSEQDTEAVKIGIKDSDRTETTPPIPGTTDKPAALDTEKKVAIPVEKSLSPIEIVLMPDFEAAKHLEKEKEAELVKAVQKAKAEAEAEPSKIEEKVIVRDAGGTIMGEYDPVSGKVDLVAKGKIDEIAQNQAVQKAEAEAEESGSKVIIRDQNGKIMGEYDPEKKKVEMLAEDPKQSSKEKEAQEKAVEQAKATAEKTGREVIVRGPKGEIIARYNPGPTAAKPTPESDKPAQSVILEEAVKLALKEQEEAKLKAEAAAEEETKAKTQPTVPDAASLAREITTLETKQLADEKKRAEATPAGKEEVVETEDAKAIREQSAELQVQLDKLKHKGQTIELQELQERLWSLQDKVDTRMMPPPPILDGSDLPVDRELQKQEARDMQQKAYAEDTQIHR